MKITAYETRGKIESGNPDLYTGRYIIHLAIVYGNFFQRHSWEKPSGEYVPDNWIRSYFTKKENFDRQVSKMTKIELEVKEEDFS